MKLRTHFFSDGDSSEQSGKKFNIINAHDCDTGGDELETMYTVAIQGGPILLHVNAECVFSGYDLEFDKKFPS